MKMDLIIKPNKWYDTIKEPKRFLLFLFLVVFLLLGGDYIFKHLDMVLVGILGLYRVSYFLIMDYRKLGKSMSKEKK